MADRLIAVLMLWSMRLGLAWLIAHQYVSLVGEKLDAVSRALGTM